MNYTPSIALRNFTYDEVLNLNPIERAALINSLGMEKILNVWVKNMIGMIEVTNLSNGNKMQIGKVLADSKFTYIERYDALLYFLAIDKIPNKA